MMAEVNLGEIKVVLGDPPRNAVRQAGAQPRTLSLAEARKAASFSFRVPVEPGAGLTLQEVVHIEAEAELVILSYARSAKPGGEPGWFTIVQGPVAQYARDGAANYLVVGKDIEEAKVSGKSAAAISMPAPSPQFPTIKHLVWTEGGLVQHVIGDGLHGVDLAAVAGSLK